MLDDIRQTLRAATLENESSALERLISLADLQPDERITIAGYGVIFSAFLVAEYNLQGMDAFQISFEGIKKNFLGLLGSSFAGMILSTAGILLCYIPFILMLPLFMGSTFVCYRKIFRAPPKQPMSRVNPATRAPF